jgi:hypothetical protein
VARTYAGILGSLAFGIIVARTLLDNGSAEAAMRQAPWVLSAFAIVGYGIGWIAERTIVEAIETRFRAQLRSGEPVPAAESQGAAASSSGNHPA